MYLFRIMFVFKIGMKGFGGNYKILLGCILALSVISSCDKIRQPNRGSVMTKGISVAPVIEQTKGSVMTTNALENMGRFVLEAYVDDEYCDYENDPDGENPFPEGKYVERVASGNVIYGSGTWNLSPGKNWVSNVNTSFWCWAPATLKPIPAGISVAGTTRDVEDYDAPYNSERLRFSYDRPGIVDGQFPLVKPDGSLNDNYSKFVDADIQDDLVFAYAKQKYDERLSNDEVNLVFYHALSQIRFAVSPDDGSYDSTLKIVQIAVKNIKQGGQCEFNGAAASAEDKFIWDLNSSPLTSYCQNYNASFSSAPAGWTNGTYKKYDDPSDIEHSSFNTYRLYTAQNVFFVTPQNPYTQGASLVILFEDHGNYVEVETPFENDDWKPGFYYTYKLKATVLGRTISVSAHLIDWQMYDDKIFL